MLKPGVNRNTVNHQPGMLSPSQMQKFQSKYPVFLSLTKYTLTETKEFMSPCFLVLKLLMVHRENYREFTYSEIFYWRF